MRSKRALSLSMQMDCHGIPMPLAAIFGVVRYADSMKDSIWDSKEIRCCGVPRESRGCFDHPGFKRWILAGFCRRVRIVILCWIPTGAF